MQQDAYSDEVFKGMAFSDEEDKLWDVEVPRLILYIKEGCPFCEKVEAFADEAGIPLMFRDIAEPAYREELLEVGGKVQVPFLVDEARGVAMYESEDIIAYLEEHYA